MPFPPLPKGRAGTRSAGAGGGEAHRGRGLGPLPARAVRPYRRQRRTTTATGRDARPTAICYALSWQAAMPALPAYLFCIAPAIIVAQERPAQYAACHRLSGLWTSCRAGRRLAPRGRCRSPVFSEVPALTSCAVVSSDDPDGCAVVPWGVVEADGERGAVVMWWCGAGTTAAAPMHPSHPTPATAPTRPPPWSHSPRCLKPTNCHVSAPAAALQVSIGLAIRQQNHCTRASGPYRPPGRINLPAVLTIPRLSPMLLPL